MFMIVADKVSTIIKNQRFVIVKLLLLKIIFIISYYFVLFLYIFIYFLYIFYIFFIIFIIFIIFQSNGLEHQTRLGDQIKKVYTMVDLAKLIQFCLVLSSTDKTMHNYILSRFEKLVSTKSCEQRIPAVFVSVDGVIVKILTSFAFRTFHGVSYLTN